MAIKKSNMTVLPLRKVNTKGGNPVKFKIKAIYNTFSLEKRIMCECTELKFAKVILSATETFTT
jgi:hypothetical protein